MKPLQSLFSSIRPSFGYCIIFIVLSLWHVDASCAQSLSPVVSTPHRSGYAETPRSSEHRPEDRGKRAHTNFMIWHDAHLEFAARKNNTKADPSVLNTSPSAYAETPASIACVYQLVTPVTGCPISSTTTLPPAGGTIVAIVDAYDDPNAASDLATFSTYYGLPSPTFYTVYATGTRPAQDTTTSGGWELEESLDIEWAHAMAPSAEILLVEAASNSNSDLMAAEQVASQIIQAIGDTNGSVVSNSFGDSQYSGETSYDTDFTAPGVTYFAATGDCSFCVEYPASSPNVIAVGGTVVNRDGYGNYTGETYWTSGGGGLSDYESRPSYQSSISSLVGSYRGSPDIAGVADASGGGVAIYDSFPYEGSALGWVTVAGTSVATPIEAARSNATGRVRGVYTNTDVENYMYGELAAGGTAYSNNFTDITSGSSSCVTGWDICSGIGSPIGVGWLAPIPTVIRPNAYDDLGSDALYAGMGYMASTQPSGPTVTPHGSYLSDPAGGYAYTTAAVNVEDTFTYVAGNDTDQQQTAQCTWTFGSQVLTQNSNLYIPYSFDLNSSSEQATFTIAVTISGTTTEQNVFAFYGAEDGIVKVPIASGTNMNAVSVTIYGYPQSVDPGIPGENVTFEESMYLDVFVQ